MLLISWTYIDTVSVKENQKEGETKWSLRRIPESLSTCQAQPAFEAYTLDLINLYRHSFHQGELEGGNNLKYHWEGCPSPSAPAKPSRRLRLMLLILWTYIDTVSVKENQKEGETEMITEKDSRVSEHVSSPASVWGLCYWSYQIIIKLLWDDLKSDR